MIKLLVVDVDGTLTDGSIFIGDNGEVMKRFNLDSRKRDEDTTSLIAAIP